MHIASFTFNDFFENTYILYDETKECIIIDPGCNNEAERKVLVDFIEANELIPKKLVNTHCHIDHVLGNKFVAEKYNLKLWAHKGEIPVLQSCEMVSNMYGIQYTPSPAIQEYLEPGKYITFGDSELELYFTPGHSPASVSLFHRNSKTLIAGDVLFQGSIGRTDLPGGDFDTLISSIKTQLFPLGDDVKVYNGHGNPTEIGIEKRTNPFLQEGVRP